MFNARETVGHCLGRLPPSVTVLSLHEWSLFTSPLTGFALHILPHLEEIAPRLAELVADDREHPSEPLAPVIAVHARGGWEALLARMANLHKLKIGVCAFANLSDALLPLEQLRELELDQFHSVPPTPALQGEVLDFVRQARALRRLVVAHAIWSEWSGVEVDALKCEAGRKGVKLELVPEMGTWKYVYGKWEGRLIGDAGKGEQSDA